MKLFYSLNDDKFDKFTKYTLFQEMKNFTKICL